MSPGLRSLVLPVLLVASCDGGRDPILDRAAALDGAPVAANSPGRAVEPSPGAPPDPSPGAPPDPSPGTPQPPAPGVPDQPPPPADGGGAPGAAPSDGPMARIAGTIVVADYKGGPVRVDVFDGDQQAAAGGSAPRPGVVAVLKLDRPGPFSLSVPVSVGQVWVGGFVDQDLDGRPGPLDPHGWYGDNPIAVGQDVSGVLLTLEAAPPPPPGEGG